MRLSAVFLLLGTLFVAKVVWAEPPDFKFPLIAKYGGVVFMTQAAEPPRAGVKIIFDITAESKAEDVNRGIENVARYLNLNALAGNSPNDVKLALVLHGDATRCALSDEAYSRQTNVMKNPNLPLLRELKTHSVEIYVCGQSMARNQLALSDAAAEVTVAASAMTVNANKQQDGFSYLAVH